MQEVKYEAYLRNYRRSVCFQPESVIAVRKPEKNNKHCNSDRSCRAKYRIKVHRIRGLVYYQCHKKMFRSLYHAKLYAKGRRGRYVRFGIEDRILFKNEDPPCEISKDKKYFRERSKSVV
uniref:FLYWCH-type domain-containing protein n=1 Tax=Strongyloides papillosus TaxID=174720 RepID=A0A0N5BL68_STREA